MPSPTDATAVGAVSTFVMIMPCGEVPRATPIARDPPTIGPDDWLREVTERHSALVH